MYLKNIKAHGFKSFADKINIELDTKLTGIVGPNGSGKSNIVDAVRWVLGEQSVKSLRGDTSMTDIIFSGSKSRNPLNVATVTLVLDNSDNYLPNVELHSASLKPTRTKLSPISNGRFTSIPSLARSFSISSSDLVGSLFLRSRDL